MHINMQCKHRWSEKSYLSIRMMKAVFFKIYPKKLKMWQIVDFSITNEKLFVLWFHILNLDNENVINTSKVMGTREQVQLLSMPQCHIYCEFFRPLCNIVIRTRHQHRHWHGVGTGIAKYFIFYLTIVICNNLRYFYIT